jgi:hypothetical protein
MEPTWHIGLHMTHMVISEMKNKNYQHIETIHLKIQGDRKVTQPILKYLFMVTI